MSDDGEEVLDNVIRDLEKTQDLLARAEVIAEGATNRLKLYRERYDDNHPMPPDESDFIGGNKTVYSGPPEDDHDEC